jgi:outer membrane biogenesis lipoprotein LolB
MKIIKTGLFVVIGSALLMMTGCSSTPATDVPAGYTLAGTKWRYSDKDWQYDLEFSPNGTLYTTHPNDKSKGNDTWEQNGETVRFYYNNKFSTYTGSFSDNRTMSGTASNKNGANWDWKATRAD